MPPGCVIIFIVAAIAVFWFIRILRWIILRGLDFSSVAEKGHPGRQRLIFVARAIGLDVELTLVFENYSDGTISVNGTKSTNDSLRRKGNRSVVLYLEYVGD